MKQAGRGVDEYGLSIELQVDCCHASLEATITYNLVVSYWDELETIGVRQTKVWLAWLCTYNPRNQVILGPL